MGKKLWRRDWLHVFNIEISSYLENWFRAYSTVLTIKINCSSFRISVAGKGVVKSGFGLLPHFKSQHYAKTDGNNKTYNNNKIVLSYVSHQNLSQTHAAALYKSPAPSIPCLKAVTQCAHGSTLWDKLTHKYTYFIITLQLTWQLLLQLLPLP